MKRRLKRALRNTAAYVAAGAACIFFLFPVFFMVTAAFKTDDELSKASPSFFLFEPSLVHFRTLFQQLDALQAAFNSVVIVTVSTAIGVTIGGLAAYSLTHFKVKGQSIHAIEILSVRMLPPIVTAIPFYLLSQRLGIHDTYLVMILVYTLAALPLATWILGAFMTDVPRSIEEAGLVDGCTQLQVLYRVTLPLLLPGIAATVLIVVMASWNEYLFASLLTSSDAKTLPVIAAQALQPRAIAWGLASAAGVLMSLPVVVLALALQRYLVRGLSLGVVKG